MSMGFNGELATMLDKLGFDRDMATKIAQELDKQTLGNDATLKGLRDLFKEAGKSQSIFDNINSSPGAMNKAIEAYIKKQKGGSSVKSYRGAFARKFRTVSLGTLSVTVKANKRKAVKLRLNTFGRKLTTAFRKAGVGSISTSLKLSSVRVGTVPKGVKKKVSVTQSLEVAL